MFHPHREVVLTQGVGERERRGALGEVIRASWPAEALAWSVAVPAAEDSTPTVAPASADRTVGAGPVEEPTVMSPHGGGPCRG